MIPSQDSMVVPSEPTCAADEERVLCIIRDMTNSLTQTKFNLNYPASITCYKLIEEIGKNLGYDPASFLLTYEQPNDSGGYEEVTINDVQASRLGEICVNCGNSRRNIFNVMEKDGPPIKVLSEESPESTELPTSHLDTVTTETSYSTSSIPVYGPHLPLSHTNNTYSHSSSLVKSDTGYVGLVNQAMTCYLSSLLQTLYMTPEFRNAVYRWEFVGSQESKSIPYQLQKLFLQLQTSKRRAVETTDITKSFGWDSSEAWQQHDVQELCRVMFDALEKTWGKSGQGELINQLYQGKMKDYVKCLECDNESARSDTFLDIPLVIRPFGSEVSYSSVEQAINAFVEPEILDGNNQYFCEKCNKKCNAHKGLKFVSFPYMLTLQLKRFDFDYVSLHRIKLNDRVTFPGLLSLNHLIETAAVDDDGLACNDGESQANGAGVIDISPDNSPGAASSPSHMEQDDEEIDVGIDIGYSASGNTNVSGDRPCLSSTEAAANDKNINDSKKRGPYEYELFSIMIHSGSAAGGHYYAYIKSFDDHQWYSFNDQHVSTITADDIKKTYGGAPSNRGYYSSAYASSTNAYMLMYRQIDVKRNDQFYTVETFPQHLKDELSRIQDREDADRRQRELDKNLCKIRLFCFHPEHSKLLESRLVIHKDKMLADATEMAWQLFELEKIVPLDCCRLIKYDETLDYIDQSYDDKDDVSIGVILGGVKLFYAYELLLELKQPGYVFQEYKPGGVTVKVHIVDLETETIGPPVTVRAYLTQTVDEYKSLVSQMIQVPKETMRCVRERYYNDLRLLLIPGRTLKAEGFSKSNKVFIECSGLENDDELLFPETRLYKLLDRYENTIRLHITLPPYVQGQRHDTNNIDEHKSKSQSKVSDDVDEGMGEADGPYTNDGGGGDTFLKSRILDAQDTSVIQSNIGDAINQERLAPDGQESTGASGGDTNDALNSSQNVADGDSSKNFHVDSSENWDLDGGVVEWDSGGVRLDEEYRRYFTAQLHINTQNSERALTVYVDKRIMLGSLKKELEKYVGTSGELFKVYRVYSNSQEVEVSRISETLSTYSDDSKLAVKIGRALRKGEYRVKVYLLQVNQEEVTKLLVEAIFARGMTVRESKSIVQKELKLNCDMDVSLDRIRLRKKSWKNPTKIYQDDQVYEQDITILTNWEIFLEILDVAERVTDSSHLSVYTRRWHPAQYTVDPLHEIILREQTLDELRQIIADVGDIPLENVEFAKAKGTFPCEVSLLDVHADMDWHVPVTSLNMYPLSICEDGAVIYYRDKTEKLMEISDKKKKELQQKENSRSSYSSRIHYSPRKERALKIYTDDSPRNSTSQSQPLSDPTPLLSNTNAILDLD